MRASAFIPATATAVSGDTCAFTADYLPTSSTNCQYTGTGGGRERVYYFYVDAPKIVTFSGCTAGTVFDTTAYFRSVCSDAAQQPDCNDDGCGGNLACDKGLRSSVTATLSPGLYYFFADGYDSGTSSCPCGNFSYAISGL